MISDDSDQILFPSMFCFEVFVGFRFAGQGTVDMNASALGSLGIWAIVWESLGIWSITCEKWYGGAIVWESELIFEALCIANEVMAPQHNSCCEYDLRVFLRRPQTHNSTP